MSSGQTNNTTTTVALKLLKTLFYVKCNLKIFNIYISLFIKQKYLFASILF